MKNCKWELTKDEFERLNQLDPAEKERAVKKMLGADIVLGYGLYGWRLRQEGDGFFLEFTMGSHCD